MTEKRQVRFVGGPMDGEVVPMEEGQKGEMRVFRHEWEENQPPDPYEQSAMKRVLIGTYIVEGDVARCVEEEEES